MFSFFLLQIRARRLRKLGAKTTKNVANSNAPSTEDGNSTSQATTSNSGSSSTTTTSVELEKVADSQQMPTTVAPIGPGKADTVPMESSNSDTVGSSSSLTGSNTADPKTDLILPDKIEASLMLGLEVAEQSQQHQQKARSVLVASSVSAMTKQFTE